MKSNVPKPVEKRSTTLGSAQFGLWLIVLIVFLGAAYSNSFRAAFVYDDKLAVLNNQTIRSIFPLSESFRAVKETPTAGRPLVNFTLAVNYALGGVDVFGYHAVNWGFHLLNAVWLMVWLSLTVSVADRSRSLGWLPKTTIGCVVLLWAVHPLLSEAVTYVSQRTELMVSFFLLTTLMLSHLSRICSRLSTRFICMLGAVSACGLGMACKEVMVVAPLLVVLSEAAFSGDDWKTLLRNRGRFYLCLFATWVVLGWLISSNPRGMSAGFAVRIGVFDYLTTQFWAVVWYLRLAFWPSGLCGDYGATTITQIDRWLPCFAILMSLGIATIVGWFRDRRLAFWGCWFFLILAPSSSFVPIATEPIAERRMYLPLLSVLILSTVLLRVVARKFFVSETRSIGSSDRSFEPFLSTGGYLIGLGLGIGFAAVTFLRNEVYRSEVVFWKDVIEKLPTNARGYQHLGLYYMENRVPPDLDRAEENLLKACELAPNHVEHFVNIGALYNTRQEFDAAIRQLDAALRIDPTKVEALYNRGKAFTSLGNIDAAIDAYQQTIRYNPDFTAARINLGSLFFSRNEYDRAAEQFEILTTIPGVADVGFYNLGIVHTAQGESEAAIRELNEAERLGIRNVNLYKFLGHSHGRLGQVAEAKEAFLKAAALNPDDPEVVAALQEFEQSAK